jgi:hypothetical protein
MLTLRMGGYPTVLVLLRDINPLPQKVFLGNLLTYCQKQLGGPNTLEFSRYQKPSVPQPLVVGYYRKFDD